MFYGRLIKPAFLTRVGRDRKADRWINFCGLRSLKTSKKPDVWATYDHHGSPGDAERLIRYVTRDGSVAKVGSDRKFKQHNRCNWILDLLQYTPLGVRAASRRCTLRRLCGVDERQMNNVKRRANNLKETLSLCHFNHQTQTGLRVGGGGGSAVRGRWRISWAAKRPSLGYMTWTPLTTVNIQTKVYWDLTSFSRFLLCDAGSIKFLL
jgi:hypothetical protein